MGKIEKTGPLRLCHFTDYPIISFSWFSGKYLIMPILRRMNIEFTVPHARNHSSCILLSRQKRFCLWLSSLYYLVFLYGSSRTQRVSILGKLRTDLHPHSQLVAWCRNKVSTLACWTILKRSGVRLRPLNKWLEISSKVSITEITKKLSDTTILAYQLEKTFFTWRYIG